MEKTLGKPTEKPTALERGRKNCCHQETKQAHTLTSAEGFWAGESYSIVEASHALPLHSVDAGKANGGIIAVKKHKSIIMYFRM